MDFIIWRRCSTKRNGPRHVRGDENYPRPGRCRGWLRRALLKSPRSKEGSGLRKRVVLAAGTMSTLRLLFAGSRGESAGLNPMPSLGHRFGGNGDLIGAWFKPSVRSPMFESAPVLGRFKVDGQDTPFLGMWSLAGIEKVPLLPGWKKKLAKTVPLIGMGADTGKVTVRFQKGRLKVDYDPNQQPIFERIRAAFLALGTQTGLKTWAIKKPITVHAWGGLASVPVPKVASSITRARFTETPAFSSRMRPRYRPRSGRLRRSLSRRGLTTSLTVSHTPRREIRESIPSRFQFERIIDRTIYHETMSSGTYCSLPRARRAVFGAMHGLIAACPPRRRMKRSPSASPPRKSRGSRTLGYASGSAADARGVEHFGERVSEGGTALPRSPRDGTR